MTQPEPQIKEKAEPEHPVATATKEDLRKKIAHFAGFLSHLSTGDLAVLRRGPLRPGEAGAPAFWRLSVHKLHGFPGNEEVGEKWAAIIQAMALLTHRSADGEGHNSPHDSSIKLGAALCDGGDRTWPGDGDARPALSELRLARLLNSHGDGRRDQLLRAIRMLARAGNPLNCTDIAYFILTIGNDKPARSIAKSYYTRLSQGERKAKSS